MSKRRKVRRRHVGTRWLDGRLYQVYRYEPSAEAESVASRTNPRQNSFDQSYMKGRFPMWIRPWHHHWGHEKGDEDDTGTARPRKTLGVPDGSPELLHDVTDIFGRRGYNRSRAEEPYVEALAEFFDTRITLMPPKTRQVLQDVKDRLHAVMYDGRSFEDQARDLGVTKQAVQQAQARAVEQLVESCGGKAALAEKLREFLHAKEQADGQDRLKYLPRWVHG